MQKLLTILFFVYFFSSCALLYTVNALICLLSAFDPERRAVHWFSCYWGMHYFYINPFWQLDYQGVEQIDHKKTYVIIANHQSFADILICYGLYRHFKWVSKSSVAKVPFVGWNMFLNQYVLLERGDLKSIKGMMQACRDWLNKGSSIMLFPEGTRSPDGHLQAFRDGAFKLSLDCNVELVPVVIEGSANLLSKGSSVLNFRQKVKIRVLPPFQPKDYEGRPGKYRCDVHDAMARTLADLRGVPVSQVIEPATENHSERIAQSA
jgi:1-acyl-sn-glycerol-3-phosphate acyltransferase